MTRLRLCSSMLAGALVLASAAVARAGMDVSLEREFRRLEEVRKQVESLPAYRQSEELKHQITTLLAKIESLAQEPPRRSEADKEREREQLRRQITQLRQQLDQASKIIVDFRTAIGDGQRERFFPDTRHRLAVFTFDDPHGTELGDPISFLLSKKLLFSTRVSSFAIVNYRQGAGQDPAGNLAYFDRVDAITKDQSFLLAMWGRLSRNEQGVRIDSFLQVPADAKQGPYARNIRLPEAMGGGTLNARLKPDRVKVQTLLLDAAGIDALRKAASDVASLRANPDPGAAVTANLAYTEGRAYTITASERGWVRLRFADGTGGWTSIDQFCTGVCRTLLDAANFTNDVVALTSRLPARAIPESLTREARAVSDQLSALGAIPENPVRAVDTAERWTRGDGGRTAPGGAGFANLLAVARVRAELARTNTRDFNRIRLPRQTIERIVQPLVEASIADPGDIDVVENLAVLFAYLGDNERKNLAQNIAESLKSRAR
jgi:hypothetical protein